MTDFFNNKFKSTINLPNKNRINILILKSKKNLILNQEFDILYIRLRELWLILYFARNNEVYDMKRSEINQLMQEAVEFFDEFKFKLPAWAYYSPEQWKSLGPEADEIRKNMLGWDITDFGLGDFHKQGLLLFTIRNGNYNDPNNLKTYAEKIMIVREEQITPMHCHNLKLEDIINRGGGNLCIQLYLADENGELSDKPGRVSTDGIVRAFNPGDIVTLTPGESITLEPRVYHKFWGEKDKGMVLVGEVSQVNDDNMDNVFYDKCGRFPEIEEDEPPLYLLCSEYE